MNGCRQAGRQAGEGERKNTVCIFDRREQWILLLDVLVSGLPGRSHQASSAVSHPAVIREVSFLGARPTVLPLQHHLSSRAERLQRWGWGEKLVSGETIKIPPDAEVKECDVSKVQKKIIIK